MDKSLFFSYCSKIPMLRVKCKLSHDETNSFFRSKICSLLETLVFKNYQKNFAASVTADLG